MQSIQKYWALLDELFINLIPVIDGDTVDKMDKRLLYIWSQIIKVNVKNASGGDITIPYNVIAYLRRIHIDLMKIKQNLGYGIEVDEIEDRDIKMARALGVNLEKDGNE